MPKFHFFTEADLMQQQTNILAYGPVLNDENTKYRVTFLFEVSQPAKAFAVCDGVVFVQPLNGDINSDYVNLVLKPTGDLENGFTPVEYFVYRGLKKANFIQGQNTLVPYNHADSTDLTNGVWENADDFHPVEPDSTADEKAFGWDKVSESDSAFLNSIFNETDDNHQLHHISKGMFIGYFDSTVNPAGFEIVLRDRMYFPDLGMVRGAETTFSVNAPGGTDIPGNEPIATMREREKILNFVDPAAYMMLFYESGIHVENKNTAPQDCYGFNDIYNVILVGNGNPNFHTKNTLYIDIRNENGCSLNYYKDNEGISGTPDYGMHIQRSWDGINFTPLVYYSNFWPIFATTFLNAGTSDSLLLFLKVREDYNPKPFVYLDFATQQIISGSTTLIIPIEGATKIRNIKNLSIAPDGWSESIELSIPIISDTISWIGKIYVGKHDYNVIAPNTSFIKQHYLDYLFGPLNAISNLPPASETEWKLILGKKLISTDYPFGFVAAIEMVLTETPTLIDFSAVVVDLHSISSFGTEEHTYPFFNRYTEILNGPPPSNIGKSIDPNFIFHPDKTLVDISTKNSINVGIDLMTFSYLDSEKYKPKICQLVITRSEYDSYIRPAISLVDENLHDATLNLIGISGTQATTQSSLDSVQDSSGFNYYEGLIKIHGMDSNGIHAIDNPLQNIEIGTLNGKIFQSINVTPPNSNNASDSLNAYFSINDAIDYIKKVEGVYWKDVPLLFEDKDNTLGEVCTRIRVHSYGQKAKVKESIFSEAYWGMEIFAKPAFENLIIQAPYVLYIDPDTDKDVKRFLKENIMSSIGEGGRQAYNHLTSNSDENSFQDNPSPYVSVPRPVPNQNQTYQVDFGQILYGFESFKLPAMYSGYEGYNDYLLYTDYNNNSSLPFPFDQPIPTNLFPLQLISFDYSGIIANVATPVAEYFYHLKKTKSSLKGVLIPNIADLDFYYSLSAPEADLFGNADARGLYSAWLRLGGDSGINPNLKLSEIFDFYYSGFTTRTNFDNSVIYFSSNYRWRILAIYLGFLVENPVGTFTWLPDQPLNSDWKNLKNKFRNVMWIFIEFWYNQLVHRELTALRIADVVPVVESLCPIHRFIWNGSIGTFTNKEFNQSDFNSTTQLDFDTLKSSIDYCLINKFLPFLKSKIQEESPGII